MSHRLPTSICNDVISHDICLGFQHTALKKENHVVLLCFPVCLDSYSTSSLPYSAPPLPQLPLHLLSPDISFPPLPSSFSPLIAPQLIEFCPLQQAPKSLLHGNRPQLHWSGDRQIEGREGDLCIIITERLWFVPLQSDPTVSLTVPHLPGSAWICRQFVEGLLNKCKLKPWLLTNIF